MFEQTVRLRYLLFLPRDYGTQPDEKWPLILFLSWDGRTGPQPEAGQETRPSQDRRSGSPTSRSSSYLPNVRTKRRRWDHHLTLKALLDQTVGKLRGRHGSHLPDRVQHGGIWHGGAWQRDTQDCSQPSPPFVAVASLTLASALKAVPVWAFHGAEDDVVKLEVGQRMVDALRACGGSVRFTVYPGVGHDSWTQTYDNPELYEWFLQHRR